jgi:hypothetical protein
MGVVETANSRDQCVRGGGIETIWELVVVNQYHTHLRSYARDVSDIIAFWAFFVDYPYIRSAIERNQNSQIEGYPDSLPIVY